MQHCFNRIIELLGKSESDPTVAEFLSDAREIPRLIANRDHLSVRSFAKLGFTLTSGKRGFTSACLHLAPRANVSDSVRSFSAELPFGIKCGDHRKDIELRIGHGPIRSQLVPGCTADSPQDYWDDYSLEQFNMRCMFYSDTQKLSAVSISLPEYVTGSSRSGEMINPV